MSSRPKRLVSVALDRLHQLQMDNLTLTTQRDALLDFAKYVEAIDPGNPAPLFEKARAAIKQAEGEKT